MKKVAVAVLAMALMTMALAVPAMAEPAQKFPITLDTEGSNLSPPERTWTTEGGIVHAIDSARGGPVYLTIGTGPKIEGNYRETAITIINTKTEETVVTFHKMVCNFPGGSFEGTKTAKTTSEIIDGKPVAVAMEQHGVLHGSGICEGQTLKIGYDWVLTNPPLPRIYTGALIVPQTVHEGVETIAPFLVKHLPKCLAKVIDGLTQEQLLKTLASLGVKQYDAHLFLLQSCNPELGSD